MRELPILACDSVAKALWEGIQTQHRVPMKKQPPDWIFHGNKPAAPWSVGDVLYVREACRFEKDSKGAYCVRFRADDSLIRTDDLPYEATNVEQWLSFQHRKGWTGNQNMLKAVARTRLLVKHVWCERIQDISEEDAREEGLFEEEGIVDIVCYGGPTVEIKGTVYAGTVESEQRETAKEAFRDLWNSLYGKKHPWESNPWVWACEFERIER